MIWFFMAGMVAGAIGITMFAGWWVRKRTTVVKITKENVEKSNDEDGYTDKDVSGN